MGYHARIGVIRLHTERHSMTETPEPRIGIPDMIGRYRIVRPLSKGGMALVFEARRDVFGGVSPRFALKMILPDFANSNTFRELFINEARLGAQMRHQNLVQIVDFAEDKDRWFIVMEYVEGLTLSKIISTAARHDLVIPLHVLCEIGRQACEGLHFAHQASDGAGQPLGLIHRDIKPSNLMVTAEGGVKILDFGISKGRLRNERTGTVKGTWGYMAPEQAVGERIGPNADIFALGIVLWEMAARRSMFKGYAEEDIRRLLSEDHASRVVPTLDAQYSPLIKVLQRALARHPRERFATAADFGRALSDLLPDPVTVRDEMSGFFNQVDAIQRRETPKRVPVQPDRASSESRPSPNGFTLDGTREHRDAMLWSALAGMTAVVIAFVIGFGLYRALASHPDDAPPPDRPLPVEPAAIAPATPAPVAPAAPPAQEPAPTAPTGMLTLGSVQKGDVYVNGALLLPPYGEPRSFPAGHYIISVVSPDGRRVTVALELAAGQEIKRIWDFEHWKWK